MRLSIVMPYYRNPEMLARQYRVWAEEWPDRMKEQIEVVIIDDGSPDGFTSGAFGPDDRAASVPRPPGLPELSIFRVLEDRPWHQHGARNLGAHVARAPWLLMTDMDHIVPAITLRFCLVCARDRPASHPDLDGRVFTFGRHDAPAGEWKAADFKTWPLSRRADGSIKPHVNSFKIQRAFYWHVGGYDETFCGVYGTDGRFRRRLWSQARHFHMPMFPLIRVDREVIADASTRDVARKEGRDPDAKKAIERAKKARGETDKIVTLNFPWERVI